MLNGKRLQSPVLALLVTALVLVGGHHSAPSSRTPVLNSYSPDGVRLRADDGPWLKPLDFLTGSLSTGLSLAAEDRINRATMSIEADRR